MKQKVKMNSMKRAFLSTVMILTAVGSINARPLSPDAALERIGNIQSANPRLKMAARKPRLVHTLMAGGVATIYVFNQDENDGFMILSADDVAPVLLAYSDNGTIDMDDLPPALGEWLTSLSEDIGNVVANRRTPRTSPNTTGGWDDIEPLVTTHWGQDSPENLYCPLFDGTPAVVGCAATAMAQIMNYYEWPKHGKGKISYTPSTYGKTIEVDFDAEKEYDWNNMADWYGHSDVHEYGGSWYGKKVDNTQAEKEAVALLSYHAGVATYMNYGPESSGAQSSTYVTNGSMVNNFSYDQRIKYVERNYAEFSGKDDQWEQMIYNELAHQRPIYYTGHSAKGGGHAFVCDGYQKQVGTDGNIRNFFHINWGWEGISDGYYLITAFYAGDGTPLYPTSQSIGGSGAHFSDDQGVIIGIRPNNTKYLYSNISPDLLDASERVTEPIAGNEYKLFAEMYNGCFEKTTYYYGVEFFNIDTEESTYLKLTDAHELEVDTKYDGFTFTWPTDIMPGTYKVYACYRTSADGDLARVELPYNADVPTVKCVGEEFVLVDGNPYTQASDATYQSVTYTRKFYAGVWNSWFLPFDINTSELNDNHLTAACVNGVHQYDDDDDGVYERTDIEILKIKEGVLRAATPYFVKPDAEYDDKVVVEKKTLLKVSTMNSVHAETAYAMYDFIGTYTRKEDGHDKGCHIMAKDGGLRMTTSYVPAVDWYMIITAKGSQYDDLPATAQNTITLSVVGEKDEVTGIKTIYDQQSPKRTSQVLYNIQGTQVGDCYKGIVITEGKKFLKN